MQISKIKTTIKMLVVELAINVLLITEMRTEVQEIELLEDREPEDKDLVDVDEDQDKMVRVL